MQDVRKEFASQTSNICLAFVLSNMWKKISANEFPNTSSFSGVVASFRQLLLADKYKLRTLLLQLYRNITAKEEYLIRNVNSTRTFP